MFKKILLPMVFLIMGLSSVAIAYQAGHPLQAYLFHADSLYLPVLFHDLFAGGGRLADWYLTPAPYFFPDFALYLAAYLGGGGAYQQILVFALLQTALTALALFFVVSAIVERHRIATTALIALALLWFGVNAAEPFVELFTSAYHFGAFLSALVFVALWLRHERSADRRVLAALCLLAFLSALSDNIFLVQVIAPYAVTRALLPGSAAGTVLGRLRPVWPILAASVLGSLSYKLVVAHPTRYPTKLGVAMFDKNLHDLLELLGRLFLQFPLLGAVFCAYLAFGIACLAASLRKRAILGLPRPLILLIVFSLVSMAGTLSAVLLVQNLPVAPRYLIPVLIWPLVIAVLVLRHFMRERYDWISLFASALLASTLLADSIRLHGGQARPATYYPEQIACIDNALGSSGLRHGIAQYWDAKHIQAFSRHPLRLAQYVDDLNRHNWITSERFFRKTYDFAIINNAAEGMFKLPAAKLIEMNGPPSKSVTCGDRTLLMFGQDRLRLERTALPGVSLRWKGCELPTLIGKPTPACEVQKSAPDQDGFLSFGPYQSLPAGTYAYEVEYASSKAANEIAGEWDVALALPKEAKRLQAGALRGTGGELRKLSGKFTVPKEYDMARIEIRHLSNKGGTMKIVSLSITRLD